MTSANPYPHTLSPCLSSVLKTHAKVIVLLRITRLCFCSVWVLKLCKKDSVPHCCA